MWGKEIVLLSFIISLVLLGVSNPAFASQIFYQTPIVIEHTNILNITSTTTDNTITVTVASPPGDPTNRISVVLNRIGNSNNFISEFVNFTSSETNDTTDKLHVTVGSVIRVNSTIAGEWGANVIANNIPLNLADTSNAITNPLLLRSLNGVCSTPVNYGGDPDADFICSNWEDQALGNGLRINYPAGTTYILACNPLAVYSNPQGNQVLDQLGSTVCPSPTVRDMYVEIDYMQGHKPDLDALKGVVASFRAQHVNKINLHIIPDEQINHVPSILFPGTDANPGFLQIKAKKFGTLAERQAVNWSSLYTAKSQVFHYFLWAHAQSGALDSSGASDSANDGGVTLGSFSATVAGSRWQQAGTFMHELGHNLKLNHGGISSDQNNCKPNLISVMNYAYQFGDLVPIPRLDFSNSSIGTNTAGATSLGMENAIAGTAMDVANSSPPNMYMVYGIGGGQTTYQQLPQTSPAPPSWPSPWQSIRTISDNAVPPHVVCAAPTTAIALTGSNQWAIIKQDHGSGNWLQGRSEIATGSGSAITLSTDKSEYSIGSDIQVNGTVNTNPISTENVIIQVIASNGNVVTVDQLTVNPDGTFVTVLTSGGIWNQEGTYTIEASYQKQKQSVYIDLNNYAYFEIPEGTWCISLKEAEEQIKENTKLDIENAPLCNTEIAMSNVRAARLINLGNVIGNIQSLYNDKYITEDTKDTLTKNAEYIRPLILGDDVYSTLASYNEFKNLVKDKVDNEYARTVLTTLVDVSTYTLNPVDGTPLPPPLPTPPTKQSEPIVGPDPKDIAIIILIIIIIILLVILYVQNRKNTGLKKSNTNTPSFQSNP